MAPGRGRSADEVFGVALLRLLIIAGGPAAAVEAGRGQRRVVLAGRATDQHGWTLVFPASGQRQPRADARDGPVSPRSRSEPVPSPAPAAGVLIGYARCSTDKQDLAAQRHTLRQLGVNDDRVYLDHGNLAAAVEDRASTYRLGGDEFCVLLAADANLSYLLAKATAALSETGEGYHITAAHGLAMLPQDASTVTEAMSIADLRMYAQKSGGRSSVGSQMRDLLLCTLTERSKALGDHNDDVALLAREVAHTLCLSSEEVDEVIRAAELHDVGKLALPDDILFKPGPLSDEEWETMRLHTTIGQRILAASPALAGVGRLVRSSHERWDGAGYPDQLRGEHIPLGARIVAVCDAFAAMVTDRPCRKAIPRADALAELQHCAGTQFDPTVIDVFLAVMADPPSDMTWADSTGAHVSV